MSNNIKKLTITITVFVIIVFGIGLLVSRNERAEERLSGECITRGGSIEYCIDAFENDSSIRKESFKKCMIEIDDLGFCYTRFLKEFN